MSRLTSLLTLLPAPFLYFLPLLSIPLQHDQRQLILLAHCLERAKLDHLCNMHGLLVFRKKKEYTCKAQLSRNKGSLTIIPSFAIRRSPCCIQLWRHPRVRLAAWKIAPSNTIPLTSRPLESALNVQPASCTFFCPGVDMLVSAVPVGAI